MPPRSGKRFWTLERPLGSFLDGLIRPELLHGQDRDGRYRHAGKDGYQVGPERVDSKGNEDTTVRGARLDRQRHGDSTRHGATGHHGRDDAERIGCGEGDGAFGDEGQAE